jgi:alkylation response protein AidB-like acyl-CoA dehydrogenase
MLELKLNEEEALIQKVARDFLSDNVPTLKVREIERSPEGYDVAAWNEIQDLGWVGLPFGGDEGTSFVSVAVLTEELGRGCYPGPIRAAWAYGLLLERLGDTDRLNKLIDGKEVGVPALWEANDPYNAESTVAKVSADGTLSGTKLLVYYANAASVFLVLVRDEAGALRFALVDDSAVERIETPSSGGDKVYALKLDGAKAQHVYDADGAAVIKDVLPKIAAIDCAWMVGLMTKAFELSLDYTKTRVQFGRPIGSFQAIQHKIADIGVATEGGRFLSYKAAWSIDQSPEEAELAVHYAKAWLNHISEEIIKQSHQVHGAMGMTWEYDLQLATRRLKAASLSYGDYHTHRDAVITAYEKQVQPIPA